MLDFLMIWVYTIRLIYSTQFISLLERCIMRKDTVDMRDIIFRSIQNAGLFPANFGIGNTFSVIFQRPNCDSQAVVIGTIDGLQFEIENDEVRMSIITKSLQSFRNNARGLPILSFSAGEWNIFDLGETINEGVIIPCKVSCPPLMS
ncbi:MAG: hypothetical protein UR99_C0007G0003 [Candidatus Moranbacteria bacterium GW2011_GWD2_36_12]|nr:MAG: hypothetical protein UR99_C0007G0003 [Candidatus Moranbacteria bacterium GW2011_GWD2_36_12]KKQ06867.1 MAG: hypothetical protein US16_C0007G0007 [Candidatus Moranbacteria bacterium GW2011_GWE2_36_40]